MMELNTSDTFHTIMSSVCPSAPQTLLRPTRGNISLPGRVGQNEKPSAK